MVLGRLGCRWWDSCLDLWHQSNRPHFARSAELNAVLREQTLTIKAADGSILQQQGEATREQLKLEQIPDNLKKLSLPQKIEDLGNTTDLTRRGLESRFK